MSNSATSVDPRDLMARLRPMRGRDPHESGRVASNLELLFDLTFAVAIANGASQLAESLAHGEIAAGIGSFAFTSFGIIWAWINYSWFSSAYDTDDWLYRLLTLAQMVGVIVFTLGIPQLFHSVEHGHLNNTVIVAGYVIMRLVMLVQWLRAIRNDPEHRRATTTYAVTLVVAQVLWVGTAFLHDTNLPLWACFSITTAITLIEILGPLLAERGQGTPWHAHHICERHGLLTIIAIGEVITGTALTLNEILQDGASHIDWSDAILVAVFGVALAFALWWVYFLTPFAEVLHRFRERSFGFGYSHFLIWPSIAAVGGGLHLMSESFGHAEGEHVDHVVAAYALAVPVGLFLVGVFLAHYFTTRLWAGLHNAILVFALLLLALAIFLASQDAGLPIVLAIVTLVPWAVVVAFEFLGGAQHEAGVLNGLYRHDAKKANSPKGQ